MRNLLISIVTGMGFFMSSMVWAAPVAPTATTGTTTEACSGGCGATPPALASVAGGTPVAAGAACSATAVALDEAKVIAALDHNARPHSTGYCARYVLRALQAGLPSGASPIPTVPEAKNFGPTLQTLGFNVLSTNTVAGYTPQKGDAVVIQPYTGDPNNYGHVAMYDGTQWVSDFKQRIFTLKGPPPDINWKRDSFYPGNGYRKAKPPPSYVIYRNPAWS